MSLRDRDDARAVGKRAAVMAGHVQMRVALAVDAIGVRCDGGIGTTSPRLGARGLPAERDDDSEKQGYGAENIDTR